MFEYATDYTIRKLTSIMFLNIIEYTASLIDCNNNSMRWGINEVTGPFMQLKALKCIENDKGRLKLGFFNR
jgi:hypothetical protein